MGGAFVDGACERDDAFVHFYARNDAFLFEQLREWHAGIGLERASERGQRAMVEGCKGAPSGRESRDRELRRKCF